jgi:CHAT domain-containing protein
VISSYTPTLELLINARAELDRSSQQISPEILLVGQPAAPSFTPLPKTVDEVEAVDYTIRSQTSMNEAGVRREITRLVGKDAKVENILDSLPNASIVHLACHGFQNQEDPFRRLESPSR